MTPEAARRNALTAGAVTAVAGPLLVAAPGRAAALAGVEDAALLRLIGISDVVLAPGLLAKSGSWAWLAARAITNVVVGARLVREPEWRARGAALALLGLTVIDGRSAATLWKEARRAG